MTDRPSAATPEEVLTKWKREHILDKGGIPTASELIDLVRRSMAAQREASAQVVERLPHEPFCYERIDYGPGDFIDPQECVCLIVRGDAAAAIRAVE